jgi:hypothetical protein
MSRTCRQIRREKKMAKDVLRVRNDACLDPTLFSRFGKSQLPPCPPRVLLLEPGMLRRAGIIECVDDRLCEGLVRRGIANGFGRRGDRRRDSRSCPGYLHNGRERFSHRRTECMGRTRTARATSLSSIVLSASETASPTLTPRFLSSSAAARSRGFSLMLEVSYTVNIHLS